jgi:hypothetical protein
MSLLYLGPAFGFPLVDYALMTGGIFTTNSEVALWLGFWLVFFTNALIFGPVLVYFWPSLPGRHVGLAGPLLKGLVLSLIMFIVSGLELPLMGFLNRLVPQEVQNPGLFALNLGIMGTLWLLLASLAFGLGLSLVAAMGQGIEPLDTLGWVGHDYGAIREVALEQDGQSNR